MYEIYGKYQLLPTWNKFYQHANDQTNKLIIKVYFIVILHSLVLKVRLYCIGNAHQYTW